MKNIAFFFSGIFLLSATSLNLSAQTSGDPLYFDPAQYTESSLTMPTGETVSFRAYENITYVANVADPEYQTLNIYIPVTVNDAIKPAIFLKTNVGGYMASRAGQPSATDATGRALKEGYVVVIPGSRGNGSAITQADGSKLYTGTAPAGIVDLKAAIRYLRHNAARIPGDTERIITDGTSAGGAMSALMGATGNHAGYEPYLKALGAADERDDVFAAVCYCPITDLDHADMAYEWLYQRTNGKTRELTPEQTAVSEELAAHYPAHLNSLGLKMADGSSLTDANYLEYIKSFLIRSAQRARNEGFELPAETGVKLNAGRRGSGEFVTDIDLDAYFDYIISQRALKTPSAFDAMGVAGGKATPENNVFGDPVGSPANFTDYSLGKASDGADVGIAPALQERIFLMNPMNFIGTGESTVAPNWYIRHGALDRDTAFPVPVNLYTRLMNYGYNVDFFLPWNRNHSGDYNLDDLFGWINRTLAE